MKPPLKNLINPGRPGAISIPGHNPQGHISYVCVPLLPPLGEVPRSGKGGVVGNFELLPFNGRYPLSQPVRAASSPTGEPRRVQTYHIRPFKLCLSAPPRGGSQWGKGEKVSYLLSGPAATRALPASLPVYFTKFLVKRAARSAALASQSATFA